MKSRLWIAVVACACLWGLPGTVRAEVSLTPMASSPIADTGQGGQIEVVDFNDDGLDDLAIGSARAATGGVHIRLATTTDGWTSKATLAAGSPAGEIAHGDFNRDGNPDLLVNLPDPTHPLDASGSFRIFLGKGDGTFTAGQTLSMASDKVFAVPPSGQSMHLGLITDDEIPDLWVGLTRGQIGIARGIGDGTFTELNATSFPGVPTGDREGFGPITEGDFNGDGTTDFAFGMIGNSTAASTDDDSGFYVLYGRGGAGYDEPLHISSPEPYGRVTRLLAPKGPDGSSYLLVDTAADDGLTSRLIAYPTGSTGFDTLPTTLFSRTFPALPVASGEFSGDGIPDLAWVEQPGVVAGQSRTNDLRIATGSATDSFALQPAAFDLNFADSQGTASATAPGDFNGDGATDLAASFNSSDCSAQTCGTAVMLNRPVVLADNNSFKFGTVEPGTTPVAMPLTLANTGGAPARFTTLTASGSEPNRFALTGNCQTIAPGASCSPKITFDRSTVGDWSGELRIAYDGLADPIRLTFTGTVKARVEVPQPTYKATLKLSGPKKAKAGKKFKLKALVTNAGTGDLTGLSLKWKATQASKVKRQGQIKLAAIAPGKKLSKALAVAINKKKLTRGKPVKLTVTLFRQGKALATKKFNVRQEFGPANSGRR